MTSLTTRKEIIEKLTKFRMVDKYAAFYEALPDVRFAHASQRAIVSDLLNNCAKELIYLFTTAKKKPRKTDLKNVLKCHMDLISHAALDEVNKEFAYKLCWFLAEKAEVNLPKQTAAKYWGYWQVVNDEVKIVKYRKPRKRL